MFSPLDLILLKNKLYTKYRNMLSQESIIRARNDSHAKRAPRWCGLTIHFTINCPFQCLYCYIEDMSFSFGNAKPYPLKPEEYVFALLSNPYFLPGRWGTFLAIGAVSEPFAFKNHAFAVLSELVKLGNPIQFSTKAYLSSNDADKLKDLSKTAPMNPLITIITLSAYNRLEPKTPSPEKRLETIYNLSEAKLKPILFLRPVIPGINDDEVIEVMKEAKEAGARGVVIGGFRVTRKILIRLEDAGFNVEKIKSRVRVIDDKQRSVPFPEKKEIIKKAQELFGRNVWSSACCANATNAGVLCASVCYIGGQCTKCNNECYLKSLPDATEVISALSMLGIHGEVRNKIVLVKKVPKNIRKGAGFLIRTLSRRGVRFV